MQAVLFEFQVGVDDVVLDYFRLSRLAGGHLQLHVDHERGRDNTGTFLRASLTPTALCTCGRLCRAYVEPAKNAKQCQGKRKIGGEWGAAIMRRLSSHAVPL